VKTAQILAIAALAVAAMAVYDTADARIGGGRSLGVQRPSIAPKAPAPSASTPSGAAAQPVMPAQPGATLPAKPAAPAPAGASRWLGPLAGLAAGLGLAALLSHFGLSEGFAGVMLAALLAIAVIFALRMVFARRAAAQRPLAFADAPGPGAAPASFEMPPAPVAGGAPRVEPVLGSIPQPAAGVFPPGFDAEAFLRHAKIQFVRLQAAHAAGDRKALADVLTPGMAEEIGRDLDRAGARPATDVMTLDADVLAVESEGDHYCASVRFFGTLREGAGAGIEAFDEIWNLTKPADGSTGWLLAGIQQTA